MKVVLLGNYCVGKSSICHRISRGYYNENSESTIGAGFYSINFRFNNTNEIDTVIKMDIWDTSGQEKYRTITPLYYHNADIIILVFDLSSHHSFNDITYWISEIKKQTPIKDEQIFIVGNKKDIVEFSSLDDYVYKLYAHYKYFKISAKTNEGISELFTEIGNKLNQLNHQHRTSTIDSVNQPLLLQNSKENHESSCYSNFKIC